MINNKGIAHFLLNFWIKIKDKIAENEFWLGEIPRERAFVDSIFGKIDDLNMEKLNDIDIKYKSDKLFNFIPFDNQFDSIETYERGGADCNSLNRIIQVYLVNRGLECYLVHYITVPFAYSHGTCFVKETDGKFRDYDYGYKSDKSFDTLEESILNLAINKYKVKKVRCFVTQDINWKILNIK